MTQRKLVSLATFAFLLLNADASGAQPAAPAPALAPAPAPAPAPSASALPAPVVSDPMLTPPPQAARKVDGLGDALALLRARSAVVTVSGADEELHAAATPAMAEAPQNKARSLQ